MRISEIKKSALSTLKGRWGEAVILALGFILYIAVYVLLIRITQGIIFITFLLEIIEVIISPAAAYGLFVSFIKFRNGEKVGIFDYLIYGFHNYKKSWAVIWGPIYKLLGWVILLVAVMIIFTFSAVYGIPSGSTALTILSFITGIALVALYVVIIVKGLLYAATSYLMYKSGNTLKGVEAAQESSVIMKGNRGKYFLLALSFIGWGILASITFGIGLLWLMPYMQVSMIIFFGWLTKNDGAGESSVYGPQMN